MNCINSFRQCTVWGTFCHRYTTAWKPNYYIAKSGRSSSSIGPGTTVSGWRVDPDLERDHGHVKAAMDSVYSQVLLSLQDMTLKLPEDVAEVLEFAHKLPTRGETLKGVKRPPTLIHVRFRELRNSILQKRDSLKGIYVDRNKKRMELLDHTGLDHRGQEQDQRN